MPPRPVSSASALLGCGSTTIAWEAICFPQPRSNTRFALREGSPRCCSALAPPTKSLEGVNNWTSRAPSMKRKKQKHRKWYGIAPWTQQLTQQFGRVGSRMHPIVPSPYALSRVRGAYQSACTTTRSVCKLCRAAAVRSICWVDAGATPARFPSDGTRMKEDAQCLPRPTT